MMFSQVMQKSAKAVPVSRIHVKAERSSLWAASEAWSMEMGRLSGPQQRQFRCSSEWRNQR